MDARIPWSELCSPSGRALVEQLTPWRDQEALAVLAGARRDPQWAGRPEVVAAAATQARLRTRARVRFPGPARWWTPDGLEQATRPEVAYRHAQRYRDAGITDVVDLGSGAGSDALALATAGLSVTAVDRDPDALGALGATARDAGLSIEVRLTDVTAPGVLDGLLAGVLGTGARPSDTDGPGALAPRDLGCFVDPARRRGGTRTLAPQTWSPSWDWVCRLAEQVPATGAKVAPGIPHSVLPDAAQVEWVSVDGDLVEAAAWWGPLRDGRARRRAAILGARAGATGRGVHLLDDADGIPDPAIGPVGEWLVEPDPAVLRAGLVSVLAARLGGHLLDPRIAYVCGSGPVPRTPFGSTYVVQDEVPFARKRMRAWLRTRGFGDVVVKKRGVELVPEQLRTELRLSGNGPTAILVLTRTDAGPLALLVARA